MQQVIPWVHQSRRRKRHLDGFSRFFSGLTRWQTNWQTTLLGW